MVAHKRGKVFVEKICRLQIPDKAIGNSLVRILKHIPEMKDVVKSSFLFVFNGSVIRNAINTQTNFVFRGYNWSA